MQSPTTSDQLVRTAWHEAGHAVSQVLLGYPAGVVSIEPRRRWLGVAECTIPTEVPVYAHTVPLVLIPTETRRPLEAAVVMTLAGPAGEAMAPPTSSGGYQALPVLERAAVADLTKEELLFLRRGDSDEEAMNDLQLAYTYAESLVGYERAPPLVRYLATEAQSLLLAGREQLEALAMVLLQHRTLSAAVTADVLGG